MRNLKNKKKYDFSLLNSIVKILKKNNYSSVQYFPSSFSFLAVAKEHENIINLFRKNKHLIFYFSLFPKFYRYFMTKKQKACLDIFFYNIPVSKNLLVEVLGKNLLEKVIKNEIVLKNKDRFIFKISFVPYKNYIFLRDNYRIYKSRFDPKKSGKSVWMGGDSIMFLRFLDKFLIGKKFNRIIEIGSGTGIVINSISKKSKFCEAIDYNRQAVEYTFLNTKLNKIKNIKIYYSNLFSNIKNKFDLIVANPWFVDLKKGGLEEAPYIIDKLDNHLNKKGYLLMILNSYVKKGKDTAYSYLKKITIKKNFDISIFVNGYSIETDRLKDYKKYDINYYVSYNVIIKKNGTGLLKRYETSIYRRTRDFTFINLYKFINFFKITVN
jgi:precorrin-6B methylase 2